MRIDAPAAAPSARLPVVDAARGVALLAMFAYHFAWDLDYFGLVATGIGTSRAWQIFARVTAGSFLALVGVSLVLARRGGFRPRPFLRRLAIIAGAAGLVTLATWLAMREEFIYFGILHCIAASSVLALAFLRLPVVLVVAASAFCFLAPSLFAAPTFDMPVLRWLGLMTYFPRTNDYVPLLPWFGVVLAGIAAARLALASRMPLGAGWRPAGPLSRTLIWGGRHSLGIYLLHQPVFLGLLFVVTLITGPNTAAEVESFVQSCEARCTEAGTAATVCTASCVCVAERLQTEGLWQSVRSGRLTPAERSQVIGLSQQCRAQASASPGS